MVWTLDNNQVVLDTVVRVKPGVTDIRALLPPARPGFHQVNVEISPARDTVRATTWERRLFQVLGAQQVLVVAGTPGAATNVARALACRGSAHHRRQPRRRYPSQSQAWPAGNRWSWSTSAPPNWAYQRMQAIATATRDLGVGLAAFGGTNTYGPGGLAGTPLEGPCPST